VIASPRSVSRVGGGGAGGVGGRLAVARGITLLIADADATVDPLCQVTASDPNLCAGLAWARRPPPYRRRPPLTAQPISACSSRAGYLTFVVHTWLRVTFCGRQGRSPQGWSRLPGTGVLDEENMLWEGRTRACEAIR